MKVMREMCDTCDGTGKLIYWKTEKINNIKVMEKKEIVCGMCNGKGYTEYAAFTLKEAQAILKHCGLSKKDKHIK